MALKSWHVSHEVVRPLCKHVRTSQPHPLPESNRPWYTGTFDDIAIAKQGLMHVDGFEYLLAFWMNFQRPSTVLHVLEGTGNSVFIQGWVARWYPGRSTGKIIGAIVEAFDEAIASIAAGKVSQLEYCGGAGVTTKKST